jgi:hypothetical protein
MNVRLEILGDDGEWHEVTGVASVELHQELPDAEARRPRVIDQDGRPVRSRTDRPAWASTYGPPPRRH